MIVVLIIAIMLAIAIPSFISARENSRAKTCANNLREIDYAVQQYALVNRMDPTMTMSPSTWSNSGLLWPTYIRSWPSCPAQGHYLPGTTVIAAPTCDISTPSGSGNYAYGGLWYHGLL